MDLELADSPLIERILRIEPVFWTYYLFALIPYFSPLPSSLVSSSISSRLERMILDRPFLFLLFSRFYSVPSRSRCWYDRNYLALQAFNYESIVVHCVSYWLSLLLVWVECPFDSILSWSRGLFGVFGVHSIASWVDSVWIATLPQPLSFLSCYRTVCCDVARCSRGWV